MFPRVHTTKRQQRVNKAMQPTVYAVSILCMLAALPFEYKIATVYTTNDGGVRRH